MKVIVTGTTGMIGEGVLLECLNSSLVEEVLSVSRKPTGLSHPKLKDYVVPDFLTLPENDEKLAGYDACFFCAGVSSVGMKEEEYRRITYDTTLNFARALNPGPHISFVYVSGGGTDSTEKGRMMWARVKGKTENDLMKLPFKQAFGFRIGFVIPNPQQKRVLKYYRYFSWLVPFIQAVSPNIIASISQITLAMIRVSQHGYKRNIVFVKDIRQLSARAAY